MAIWSLAVPTTRPASGLHHLIGQRLLNPYRCAILSLLCCTETPAQSGTNLLKNRMEHASCYRHVMAQTDVISTILPQAYEAGISARKAAATEAASGSGREGTGLPDGLKLEEESALLVPGKKAGEMKVVREGGGGVVYTWDADKYAPHA